MFCTQIQLPHLCWRYAIRGYKFCVITMKVKGDAVTQQCTASLASNCFVHFCKEYLRPDLVGVLTPALKCIAHACAYMLPRYTQALLYPPENLGMRLLLLLSAVSPAMASLSSSILTVSDNQSETRVMIKRQR